MIRHWHCPECKKTDATKDNGVGTRYHNCPRLQGISVPMVLQGVNAKLVLREREDYIGREKVQLVGERNRPVMSIETVRDNGTDLVVLAPTATATGE